MELDAVRVDRLLDHVRRLAPAQAFVGLFATPEAVAVYASRGFTAGDMQGMFRVLPAPGESEPA